LNSSIELLNSTHFKDVSWQVFNSSRVHGRGQGYLSTTSICRNNSNTTPIVGLEYMRITATVETERNDNGFCLGERAMWCSLIHLSFIDAASGSKTAMVFFNESELFPEICWYLGLDVTALREKANLHFGAKDVARYRSSLHVGRQPNKATTNEAL
jgi:hypothetical protein